MGSMVKFDCLGGQNHSLVRKIVVGSQSRRVAPALMQVVVAGCLEEQP